MRMSRSQALREYVRENRADPTWQMMMAMYVAMLAIFLWMLTPWFPW